jgi:hypothetical protein
MGLQRATEYILAVQLMRTTCHLSWMVVTAWSRVVSVRFHIAAIIPVPATQSERLARTNCRGPRLQ